MCHTLYSDQKSKDKTDAVRCIKALSLNAVWAPLSIHITYHTMLEKKRTKSHIISENEMYDTVVACCLPLLLAMVREILKKFLPMDWEYYLHYPVPRYRFLPRTCI